MAHLLTLLLQTHHHAVAPVVIRNDEVTWRQLASWLPDIDNIVISPGPGSPCIPTDIGTSQAHTVMQHAQQSHPQVSAWTCCATLPTPPFWGCAWACKLWHTHTAGAWCAPLSPSTAACLP